MSKTELKKIANELKLIKAKERDIKRKLLKEEWHLCLECVGVNGYDRNREVITGVK